MRSRTALLIVVALLLVPTTMGARAQVPLPVSRPGIAVDGQGGGVIDPTKNVQDLVSAEMRRQDDLRAAQEKFFDAKLRADDEKGQLLFEMNKTLREASVARIDTEAKMRSDYEGQLRAAEAKRIDAIRLVDVGAAATLAQRTTEQATALATVVTQSAEVLRNQVSRAAEDTRALVATTAATALQNQQQQFQAITTRLAALEQAGATATGRGLPQDPAIVALTTQVAALLQARTNQTGAEQGRSDIIGWIVGGVGMLIAFLGMIAAFMRLRQQEPRVA